MIKLPTHIYTPPIKIKPPAAPEPSKPEKPQNSGASSGGGGGGGTQKPGGGSSTGMPSLEELFQTLLQYYDPETIEFNPVDEETLADTISKWLRPAYEQAIENRRRETERINAELDADAWSRGMGSGSYLSDVKERQYRGEAGDIDALESSYASELAGHLFNAIKEQQEQKIEVDKFNAEQVNHANEQAMNAAQALYNAMLAKTGSGSGSGNHGASSSSGTTGSTGDSILDSLLDNMNNSSKTSYKTIANAVARMSPQERKRLYDRSDPKYMALRSEILWSLGPGEYEKLMKAFPGA